MNQIETPEMISALVDGQVRGEAFARAVDAVATDPQARKAWLTYHLIGDVMRSAELAHGSSQLADRVRDRIAKEPPIATELIAIKDHPVGASSLFDSKAAAANDSSFRWKILAGFASVAAVAAIGWTVAGTFGANPQGAQMAGAPAGTGQVLESGARGTMLRDARLDELLAAHRQLGSASALQTPSGFLRNATFEGEGR